MTTTLAMTSTMPGHWPEPPIGAEYNSHYNTPVSPTRQESQMGARPLPYPLSIEEGLQAPRSSFPVIEACNRPPTPYSLSTEERLHAPSLPFGLRIEMQNNPMASFPASSSIANESFQDDPSSSQFPTTAHEEESTSTSYLIFQPVVEEDSNIEKTDWRRYDPPAELLRSQERSSHELESILQPSIERLKARHVREEEQRAATSRIERPLARAGRVSMRPRRQISITGVLDTTHLTPPSISNAAPSERALSPHDSGYGSASPGLEPSRSPRSSSRRSFGIGALFKRKDRTIVGLEELDENHLPRPQSGEGWPLPDSPLPSPLTKQAPVPESLTVECVSCLDEFAKSKLIKLSCHSYCDGCFQRLIANALESETAWPAKCCLTPIPSSIILSHLSPATAKKYLDRSAEWSIPAGERIYCAQRTCSTWIAPKHIKSLTHLASCPQCTHKTCTTCHGPSHGIGTDCPQDLALQATINLAETEGWKRCYSCHALVEHNKGCRHMTCRCKAQFCYICGLKWRTCGCSDTQLTEIQREVERRRQTVHVRNARARREEEEEREAIRAVEEFVRAEEQRVAREMEAERRREEQEIRRREKVRIAGVNRRFRGLDAELEALNNVQKVLMAERYGFETEALKKERQDALDALHFRHPTEMQYLFNESTAKINANEARFDAEYTVRLAEERRIEDQYVDELREYWKGKPAGEYKVREARDELRRDQEREYNFWDGYRREQLEAVREIESRKMDALRVKQEAEVKAVDGRAKLDGIEWRRKQHAEGRWVEAIERERLAMLGEMEGREYARAS